MKEGRRCVFPERESIVSTSSLLSRITDKVIGRKTIEVMHTDVVKSYVPRSKPTSEHKIRVPEWIAYPAGAHLGVALINCDDKTFDLLGGFKSFLDLEGRKGRNLKNQFVIVESQWHGYLKFSKDFLQSIVSIKDLANISDFLNWLPETGSELLLLKLCWI